MFRKRAARAAAVIAAWSSGGWLAQAHAHGPAPATLAALALAGDDVTLVRTSIGLARRLESGEYEYVCPSRWDGNELAGAAAATDGSFAVVHSAGQAWVSNDRGCGFELLDAAEEVALATRWGDDLLVVLDVGATTHVLGRVEQGRLSRRWETPFLVDGALADGDGVWLAGATPAPFAARLAASGDLQLTFELAGEPSRVSPRAASRGGLWLLVDGDGERRLRWVDASGWAELTPDFEIVLGPALLGEHWLAVFDGVLHALPSGFELSDADGGGGWFPLRSVDWTCLHALGERVFACTLGGLFEVEEIRGADPELVWRFSWSQLGEPQQCDGLDLDCELDWIHFAGESGWIGTGPSDTPDGLRRLQPDGGAALEALADSGNQGSAAAPFDDLTSSVDTNPGRLGKVDGGVFNVGNEATSRRSEVGSPADASGCGSCATGTGRVRSVLLPWVLAMLCARRRSNRR